MHHFVPCVVSAIPHHLVCAADTPSVPLVCIAKHGIFSQWLSKPSLHGNYLERNPGPGTMLDLRVRLPDCVQGSTQCQPPEVSERHRILSVVTV